MEPFAGYLLRSAIWLSGFFLVWIIFLRNERFFSLKRFFLLSGIIASLLLPLVTIRFIVEIPPAIEGSILSADETIASASANMPEPGEVSPVLFLAYLAVVLLLLSRTLVQTAALFIRAIKKDLRREGKARVVKCDSASPSFSFINFIFINPSLPEEERREILNHEMAHVVQRHWADLILAQLLCALQWANPLAWLWARFVKQNHEYLADQSALKQSLNPAIYRATIINQIVGSPVLSLSNSFNQSLNKKRFDMMNNMVVSRWRKLKVLFILPVAALILYACSETEYMPYAVTESNSAYEKSHHLSNISVRGIVVDDSGPVERVKVVTENQTRTVTDREGYFELDAPGTSTLTFSANGYRTRTKSISNLFMGNFYNPSPMEIGVRLYRNDQEPPPQPYRPKVETREQPSILVILNGRELADGNFYALNPSNIENITVLKGESATQVYGEKGKNGVVIITTKK